MQCVNDKTVLSSFNIYIVEEQTTNAVQFRGFNNFCGFPLTWNEKPFGFIKLFRSVVVLQCEVSLLLSVASTLVVV